MRIEFRKDELELGYNTHVLSVARTFACCMLLNLTLCRDVDGSEDMKCMVAVLTWQLHQFMYDIGQFKVTNFCFLHTINSSPPHVHFS